MIQKTFSFSFLNLLKTAECMQYNQSKINNTMIVKVILDIINISFLNYFKYIVIIWYKNKQKKNIHVTKEGYTLEISKKKKLYPSLSTFFTYTVNFKVYSHLAHCLLNNIFNRVSSRITGVRFYRSSTCLSILLVVWKL